MTTLGRETARGTAPGAVRIIAGKHRGRRIAVPTTAAALRPTANRLRETLFNILSHGGWSEGGGSALVGARVLDGFCGSGALGLEALSRGAGHCTFADTDSAVLAAVRASLVSLHETGQATVLRADLRAPPPTSAPCSLVLLDPPYGQGLALVALAALAGRGWLAPAALAVIETEAAEAPTALPSFQILDRRGQRASVLTFLRYQPRSHG
ncbi:16S rRNA (guanine966-N2)-methyltransferase [uncultured Gammaproteobacteria bacterium]